MTPHLTLVIPCYNEVRRLPRTFRGVRELLAAAPFDVEVIVVDDGSTDGTAARAVELGQGLPLTVIEAPHRGKGGASRTGVLAARGAWVFVADADWSMPPTQALAFLPPRLDGHHVAIGSREAQGAVRHGEPWRRHVMGRVFNLVVRSAVLPGLQDSQCGFKCFRSDVARELFQRTRLDGFAADVEVLSLALREGLELVEVAIDWHYDGDSRVQAARDSVAMTRDVLMVSWRHRGVGVKDFADVARTSRRTVDARRHPEAS